jgi:D-threo-aldose 1-dehydrogenase
MQGRCTAHDVPLGAAALQFSLREPRIASTVVGVSHPERVDQTVAWANWPVPDELWQELHTLLSNAPDPGTPAPGRG